MIKSEYNDITSYSLQNQNQLQNAYFIMYLITLVSEYCKFTTYAQTSQNKKQTNHSYSNTLFNQQAWCEKIQWVRRNSTVKVQKRSKTPGLKEAHGVDV